MGQTTLDNLLRLSVVIGFVALDEGDGLREYCDVAREDTLDVLVGGQGAAFLALEIGVYNRLILNAFSDVECAIVMSINVLFFVVFNLCV